MRRVLPPVIAVLAFLLVLSGCSTSNKIVTQGEATVMFKPGSKRTEQAVELNNRVTVILPPTEANQTWQIAFHDARSLPQLAAATPSKEPGGGTSIVFFASRPGTTRLRFVLVPLTSGREAIPTDAHDVVLTVR
jgi:hypothetical protein